jgi:hypothetical protein
MKFGRDPILNFVASRWGSVALIWLAVRRGHAHDSAQVKEAEILPEVVPASCLSEMLIGSVPTVLEIGCRQNMVAPDGEVSSAIYFRLVAKGM